MTTSHRAPETKFQWIIDRIKRSRWLMAGFVAAAIVILGGSGWAAYAAVATDSTAQQIACLPGQNIIIRPDGTWACDPTFTPSPSDSSSPSPTTSPSASPSPSTSPSVSPSPSSSSSGACPVAGKNIPGAADPWGGCWPGPGTAGLPAGTSLTDYTGPCTITGTGTVIDHKHVTCSTLSIQAANVVLKNSWFDGTDIDNGDSGAPSFTITDSLVTNGARDQCACIGYHNFTATRVEVIGGNRSMYCVTNCLIQDSYVHGQQLQGSQHGSGVREEQYTTTKHTVLTCDFAFPNDATGLGCSSPLTGYPDFAPIMHDTIYRNLFLASPYSSYCMYGGSTAGKPFSGAKTNATYIVVQENVFQHGANGHCADYGPITDFDPARTGNIYSGNAWDDGTLLTNANL